MGQQGQLGDNVRVVLQAAGSDYVSGLPIPFCLGHFIVLFAHMHVSGGVGCVLFATVVETWEVFLQLLSATTDVLFSLVFSTRKVHLVYQAGHEVVA